jgi:hypothetical protein
VFIKGKTFSDSQKYISATRTTFREMAQIEELTIASWLGILRAVPLNEA